MSQIADSVLHQDTTAARRAAAPRMPNFLIIGAGKGGTTSLYHYLGQHPDIYMSPLKEAKFFAYEGEQRVFTGPSDKEKNEGLITTLDRYQALFQGATVEKAVGEASPHYMFVPKACERIKHHIPRANLFAVLRDPIDRAFKSFLHLIRDGREPIRDFAKALEQEDQRMRDGYAPIWAYKGMGFYHTQLKRYFDAFDRQQLHVYLYEDLKNPVALSQQMFRALGVDDTFVPNTAGRYNISFVPRSRKLYRFLQTSPLVRGAQSRVPGAWRLFGALHEFNRVRPDCPPEVRRALIPVFRDDILRTQDLIGRDLSAWLREEKQSGQKRS